MERKEIEEMVASALEIAVNGTKRYIGNDEGKVPCIDPITPSAAIVISSIASTILAAALNNDDHIVRVAIRNK